MTICDSAPLLPAKLVLVLVNTAVIAWPGLGLTASVEMANVATPLAGKVTLFRSVAPSMNFTVPADGFVPPALLVIVAVKVTDWPKFDPAACDDVNVVVVAATVTF